ncbi:MAG TPA: YciI family protein [Phototrophicaceae bacterium]|nr:YciI family protein [Phototrophicaceae bacterium]
MTQYLLSLPHDSAEEPTMATMDPAELEAALAAAGAVNDELVASGVLVFAGGLMPPSSATTVDATGADVETTRGPLAEAPEYLGGMWIIDVPDEPTAVEWATKAARALSARIEVRAFQELPGGE